MNCQHTSNHSHVLTVSQNTFCESPTAVSTPFVDSHLHSHHHHHHHQHHHNHQLQPSLLLSQLQRRRRFPEVRQTVSAQQLSPPSPPPRHQHQQIKHQQQLQLKIREQLEQQSLQKQQWQQQAQQWKQCQKCVLQQQHHHHDHGNVPRLTVNDSGASNLANNLQRHVSLGSFSSSLSISQQRQSAEIKTRSVQQEYEYLSQQVQQNDTTQYNSSQFSQQCNQYQQRSAYKLFDESSAGKGLFLQDAPARESDAMAPTTSFSYFNHNSLKEQSTLLSELSLDFLTGFEQFSLDGGIDFLKMNESRKEDKVKTFSYFTAQPNVNFMQPTMVCSTNIDYFVNPLEAAPDICQDARPGSAYYKITISTRSDAALNDSKDCKDKSATETSLCGLNKLQVFSEIQNLELLTSPKFNDFPQDLKEYLLSERMILADVRSIIASEHSDTLQSCDENNEEKKATEEAPSLENKTYANILQSVPQHDLNSSPTSDEHSCDMKPLPAARRHNRRSKSTNSRHNVNNLKNGIKKSNHNETSNSASALEKRKRTKVPYKFRKQSSNNKNPKIYNDSWRVDALSSKKRNS